jgi:hypothetical protein
MILKTFIFWRMGLFFLALIGSLAFTLQANGALGAEAPGKILNYWYSWAQWDGGHYLKIAQSGYQNLQDTAFFPLYPLLVKFLGGILFGNYLLAGLVISNASFLVFLYILNNLSEILNKQKNLDLVFLYILFPASFFAVSFYSEGLFLLVSTLALLYFLRRQYWGAYLLAAISAITRPFGIILVFAMFVSEVFKILKNKESPKLFLRPAVHLLIGVSLFVVYANFLFTKFHDPLAFLSVQSRWSREIIDPVTTVAIYLSKAITLNLPNFMDYLDFVVFGSFFLILILGIKKLPAVIWIYSILILMFSAATATLSGVPRYALSAVGVFILLANYLSTKPKLKLAVYVIFLFLQIFLLVRFFNGYWVA